MSVARRAAVYTIGPTRPFLDVLAAGLLRRAERETPEDPLALSRATVLLPTRRACRALADAFLRLGDGRALLLPRMTPLGDVDADELDLLEGEDATVADALALPPALDGLRREVLLARLVQRLRPEQGLDHAARLARELARLLDQVQTEGLGFDRLGALVPERLAHHWQITVEFLEILTAHWPKILEQEAGIDAADRRNRLLLARAAAWRARPPADPVIAAGSTGSIPASAALLREIAGLPRGAVVLPGLDRASDPAAWREIADDPSHPQHGLALLLDRLETAPDAVAEWEPELLAGATAAPSGRAWLLSEALRPAATTDAWQGLATEADRVRGALAGLERVDCAGPEAEAGVIAVAMRAALERPGRTAALVTPDRGLARRVSAALARWGIEVDDSAGVPLADTVPGAFLRLVADMVAQRFAPVPLLAALKHPLAAGGVEPAAFRDAARLLDRALLRGPRPAPGLDGLRERLGYVRMDHAAAERLAHLLDRLQRCCGPLAQAMARDGAPVAELLGAHVACAEALAATDEMPGALGLWRGEAGEALAAFVAELEAAVVDLPVLAPALYPGLFDALLAGRVVRPVRGRHPRLAILGPLEARLISADLMILGGLNEGTWPPEAPADPWMSRPMRRDFGLWPPERRIGLAAHDFQMAACRPQVLMTRSQKVDGTPTVPARWLLRLDSVLAAAGLDAAALHAPARRYADWLTELGEPGPRALPAPPAPRPPVDARPDRLSVTEIETWMRDPYAIYARHVLGLKALEPLDSVASVAEYGSYVHDALARFVAEQPGPPGGNALARLIEIGREAFAPALSTPGVWAFWWPRFERIAGWFVELEAARRGEIAQSFTECRGEWALDCPGGPFTLIARADRIDRRADGGLEIIDYKTGSPPTEKEIEAGFAPQLPLEAAMLRAGAFPEIPAGESTVLAHWHLSGRAPPGKIVPVEGDAAAPADAAQEGLRALVARFRLPDTPYLARPYPKHAPRYSDYTHLARMAEWASEAEDRWP